MKIVSQKNIEWLYIDKALAAMFTRDKTKIEDANKELEEVQKLFKPKRLQGYIYV